MMIRLDDDASGEYACKRGSEIGHDRQHGALHGMLEDDCAVLHALGPCGADIVASKRLDHAGPRQTGYVGIVGEAQRDGRQNRSTQRGVVVHEPSGRGEPAEPHAEYLLKQRREHEQRNRQAERGQYHREIVQYRVLLHRSQRAKRYAEYQSHDHGERSKYDRIRQ